MVFYQWLPDLQNAGKIDIWKEAKTDFIYKEMQKYLKSRTQTKAEHSQCEQGGGENGPECKNFQEVSKNLLKGAI